MSELLPVMKPQRRIALTPLVDVIFLLLIFFMLTSQIAPFSLISFKAQEAPAAFDRPDEAQDPTARTQPASVVLVTVMNGGVSVEGSLTPAEKLDDLMADLRKRGFSAAIIAPRRDARVQDLISVLEAVKKASFATVSIRSGG